MFVQEFRSLDDDGSFHLGRIRRKSDGRIPRRSRLFLFLLLSVFALRLDALRVSGEDFIHHFHDLDADSSAEHVNRLDGQHVSTSDFHQRKGTHSTGRR